MAVNEKANRGTSQQKMPVVNNPVPRQYAKIKTSKGGLT